MESSGSRGKIVSKMTSKKGHKWDEEEKINESILELIDLVFDPSVQLTKEEILDDNHLIRANVINRYARINEIELPQKTKKHCIYFMIL
jgi:hypothetical protein